VNGHEPLPCPFCRGAGRDREGLVCGRCDGSGDRDACRLRYAYAVGRRHERAAISERLGLGPLPDEPGDRALIGLMRLLELVQRFEDENVRHGDLVLAR
jgi:hypothetical protein